MITSKPIATVSYNTPDFLKSSLQEMVENDILDFYAFIRHLPEKDENKPHIHLIVFPSTKINTKTLSKLLEEPDPNNPDKPPLGVKPWRNSKFDDWYLYGEHNPAYLMTKQQEREYKYSYADFVSSDPSFLLDLYTEIDRSKLIGNQWLVEAVKNKVSFAHLLRIGRIPVQLIAQYERAYAILSGVELPSVNRNGRETHSPKADTYEDESIICCRECGKVAYSADFIEYGDGVGLCYDCHHKKILKSNVDENGEIIDPAEEPL